MVLKKGVISLMSVMEKTKILENTVDIFVCSHTIVFKVAQTKVITRLSHLTVTSCYS